MLKQSVTLGLLLAATLLLVGCAVTRTGLEETKQNTLLQPQSKTLPLQTGETIDDLFFRVAQRVPAFGGMFFEFAERDSINGRPSVYYTGVLYIYLLDPSQEDAAMHAIMDVLGSFYPDYLPPREVRVLQAQYSFLQLKEWLDRMNTLFSIIPEVITTDIDDVENRLTLGLEKMNPEIVSMIEHELARLGIPREAVILEETGPFIEDSGLDIAQALDANSNGLIDDLEILQALDLWIRQAPVPGLREVITNTQLLELIELWLSQRSLLAEE